MGSIPGSRRRPGGGNGPLLQCSCLENPVGRGGWRAAVRGGAGSLTCLSEHAAQCECVGAALNSGPQSSVHIPDGGKSEAAGGSQEQKHF